jgi:hypothetical protein
MSLEYGFILMLSRGFRTVKFYVNNLLMFAKVLSFVNDDIVDILIEQHFSSCENIYQLKKS